MPENITGQAASENQPDQKTGRSPHPSKQGQTGKDGKPAGASKETTQKKVSRFPYKKLKIGVVVLALYGIFEIIFHYVLGSARSISELLGLPGKYAVFVQWYNDNVVVVINNIPFLKEKLALSKLNDTVNWEFFHHIGMHVIIPFIIAYFFFLKPIAKWINGDESGEIESNLNLFLFGIVLIAVYAGAIVFIAVDHPSISNVYGSLLNGDLKKLVGLEAIYFIVHAIFVLSVALFLGNPLASWARRRINETARVRYAVQVGKINTHLRNTSGQSENSGGQKQTSWLRKLKNRVSGRKEKSCSAEPGTDENAKAKQSDDPLLDWDHVRTFVEYEELDSLTSRMRRANIHTSLPFGKKDSLGKLASIPIGKQSLVKISDILTSIEEAIRIWGKSHDEAYTTNNPKIRSEMKPLQKIHGIIRKLIIKLNIYNVFLVLVSLVLPFIIALGLFSFGQTVSGYFTSFNPEFVANHFDLQRKIFIGIFFMISAGYLASFALAVIKRFTYFWMKKADRLSEFIHTVSLTIIYGGIFIVIFGLSYSYIHTGLLDYETQMMSQNAGHPKIKNACTQSAVDMSLIGKIETGLAVILPLSKTANCKFDSIKVSRETVLVIRFLLFTMMAFLFYVFINYLVDRYETNHFDKNTKEVSIPPELLRILGYFLTLVIFFGMIYSSLHFYAAEALKPLKPLVGGGLQGADMIPQNMNDNINVNNNGGVNFLPFSILVAGIGGMLALASRDILENYFAGMALRVNPPFDEGDRVRIGTSDEMYHVTAMGLRVATFYGIDNNTNVFIPNAELANYRIENFTQPTLDYRRTIEIYIPHVSQIHDVEESLILERAEGLLLMIAMMATGIKRPKPNRLRASSYDRNNEDSNMVDHIRIAIKRHEEIRDDQYFTGHSCIEREKFKDDTKIDDIWNAILECQETSKSEEENTISGKVLKDLIVSGIWAGIALNEDNSKVLLCRELSQIMNIICGDDNTATACLSIKRQIMTIIKEAMAFEEELFTVIRNSARGKSLGLGPEDSDVSVTKFSYRRNDDACYFVEQFMGEVNLADEGDLVKRLAKHAQNISFSYFAIAKLLWSLKKDNSQTLNKRIDETALELLDAPRVKSKLKISDDAQAYWEVELKVDVELSEQSDEIIHHINVWIEKYWDTFNLPRGSIKTKRPDISKKAGDLAT